MNYFQLRDTTYNCDGCNEIKPPHYPLTISMRDCVRVYWLCEECSLEAHTRIRKIFNIAPLDETIMIHCKGEGCQ